MIKVVKNLTKVFLVTVFVFATAMLFFGANGSAYIDPSVITYLIQVISGVIVSLGAFFCVYGRKIKKKITHKFGMNSTSKKIVETDDIKMW